MTHGMHFFDSPNDDNAKSRIPGRTAISKFEQSSADFMATNLSLDQHKRHHHSRSLSRSDRYPYEGTRQGWNKIEKESKDATTDFMEYPSNHTITCKSRPSMCVNVSQDCSGEHLPPAAAILPRKNMTTTLNDENAEHVRHSTTQAPCTLASTMINDPINPDNNALDPSNSRSLHKSRFETYLDSLHIHSNHLRLQSNYLRRVHPAPPCSSSTRMIIESKTKTHPEAPVPPDEPTTLADIARSTHSLFRSNRGPGRRSMSSELPIENATNGGVIGTLFPRHSIYAEVGTSNLKDLGVAQCIAPSLLNAFEMVVSCPMESDEDDSSVVSFVPKMATPSSLSRTDVFGEDPPTPTSSSYHDADSHPLSGCDFSRSQSASDVFGAWSNFATERNETDLRCDFPRIIQLDAPFHDAVEAFLTPSSPSTSTSTRGTEEIDYAVATPLTSQLQYLAPPSHTNRQFPRNLCQSSIVPLTTTVWPSGFPTHAFDDRANGWEEWRSQKTARIKKKVMLDARRRASSMEEEQGLIKEDVLEQQGSYGHARWSFKGRKKDQEKRKNLAFVKVHVVEYNSTGRQLVKSRVERRQKVYIDDEEFEGSFPPVDRSWRALRPSDHWRPQKRRPCWYNRIFKKVM